MCSVLCVKWSSGTTWWTGGKLQLASASTIIILLISVILIFVTETTASLHLVQFLSRGESSSADGLHESSSRLNSRLFRRVIRDELRDGTSVEVPLLIPVDVNTDQDRKVVIQLITLIRHVRDWLKDDTVLEK